MPPTGKCPVHGRPPRNAPYRRLGARLSQPPGWPKASADRPVRAGQPAATAGGEHCLFLPGYHPESYFRAHRPARGEVQVVPVWVVWALIEAPPPHRGEAMTAATRPLVPPKHIPV